MLKNVSETVALPLAIVTLLVLGYCSNPHSHADTEPGSLSGIVMPNSSISSVTAESDANTFYTQSNDDGSFIIKSLPAGTYSVHIAPYDEGVKDTTIGNVMIEGGKRTSLGAIYLSNGK